MQQMRPPVTRHHARDQGEREKFLRYRAGCEKLHKVRMRRSRCKRGAQHYGLLRGPGRAQVASPAARRQRELGASTPAVYIRRNNEQFSSVENREKNIIIIMRNLMQENILQVITEPHFHYQELSTMDGKLVLMQLLLM